MGRKNLPPPPTMDFGDDDPGLIGKVMHNQLDRLGARDGIEATRYALNVIPGGQFLDVPLAGIDGAISSADEEADYKKRFGSLDRLAYNGKGAGASVERLRNRWAQNSGDAIFSGIGAVIGGALTTLLLAVSGPIGWVVGLVGMMFGGMAGSKTYNTLFNKDGQDPLILAKQIDKMQLKRQYVSPELIEATLAANLTGDMGRRVDSLLQNTTGTRLFHVAISDPRNLPVIQGMMKRGPNGERSITDRYIIANNLLPITMLDPKKSVAEELADLVNSGRIRASQLLTPNIDLMNAIAASHSYRVKGLKSGYGFAAAPAMSSMAMNIPAAQLPFGHSGPSRKI